MMLWIPTETTSTSTLKLWHLRNKKVNLIVNKHIIFHLCIFIFCLSGRNEMLIVCPEPYFANICCIVSIAACTAVLPGQSVCPMYVIAAGFSVSFISCCLIEINMRHWSSSFQSRRNLLVFMLFQIVTSAASKSPELTSITLALAHNNDDSTRQSFHLQTCRHRFTVVTVWMQDEECWVILFMPCNCSWCDTSCW